MRSLLLICGLALLPVGCATVSQGASAPAAVADTDAARLAAMLATELDRRSRTSSASLEAAQGEMRALEAALFPAPSAGGAAAENTEVPSPASDAVLPDEMAGARSLFHAIHIASYRDLETARDGWRTLSVMFPDVLGGLEARIEPVDIEGQGHFLRLKAGPFLSPDDANTACAPFRAASVWCVPVDFTGVALESALAE